MLDADEADDDHNRDDYSRPCFYRARTWWTGVSVLCHAIRRGLRTLLGHEGLFSRICISPSFIMFLASRLMYFFDSYKISFVFLFSIFPTSCNLEKVSKRLIDLCAPIKIEPVVALLSLKGEVRGPSVHIKRTPAATFPSFHVELRGEKSRRDLRYSVAPIDIVRLPVSHARSP